MRDPEVDAPCTEALEEDPMWHWALGDPKVREAIELAIDKNVIVDKNVVIPRNREIGVDLARDAEEFAISKGGVVAIAKGQEISYT